MGNHEAPTLGLRVQILSPLTFRSKQMSDEKYSDAPVDERDKGTIVEGFVFNGILKGDWRDHKVKDTCKCDGTCTCKKDTHLKVVK